MEQFNIPASEPLPGFTDVGGYTIVYLDDEGYTLCQACAEVEREQQGTRFTGYIHWEGEPEQCAGCDKELPSEYGIPDEDQR